jgi:hypothetical protein
MKPPPVQLATTVEVPVKRSRTATRLSPGVPGDPRVADHEIAVWVTSWGADDEPLSVQMGRGFLASVTSARIGLVEPCITSNASCVDGVPGQLAWIAAQAGTTIGLGSGIGEGDGLGVGLGEGLGEGLAECSGEALERATTGPFAAQPATASKSPASAHPILTWV